MVCRLLKIPLSTLYDHRKHNRRERAYTEEEKQAVYDAFMDHNGSFGRRMMKRILAEKHICFSERKISKIMKEQGLVSKYGRKKCRNVHTSEATEKYIHENLYAMLTPEVRKTTEIWSMDFTEQKIQGIKIYTCGIVSVNRKILVGYSQGRRCTAKLALQAVEMAVKAYGAPAMIMTDRGAQFTSKAFHGMMEQLATQHSMSRPGKPSDNCFIETFWKSMKMELGKTDLLNEQTYRMVVDYYVYYYNNLRPHSSIGYQPPLHTVA